MLTPFLFPFFDLIYLFDYLNHFLEVILGPILGLINLAVFELIDFLSNYLPHGSCLRLIFVHGSIANILIF